jgi:hypothetical protein
MFRRNNSEVIIHKRRAELDKELELERVRKEEEDKKSGEIAPHAIGVWGHIPKKELEKKKVEDTKKEEVNKKVVKKEHTRRRKKVVIYETEDEESD